jgi:hypothetical protein
MSEDEGPDTGHLELVEGMSGGDFDSDLSLLRNDPSMPVELEPVVPGQPRQAAARHDPAAGQHRRWRPASGSPTWTSRPASAVDWRTQMSRSKVTRS